MTDWTPERVHEAFQARFPDIGLAVVANRQPYAHERQGGEIVVQRPAGGMALALDPVLRAVGGIWVAWGDGEADRMVVDEHDRVRVPPEDPSYTIRRIWLTEDEVERYYLGYSNQALWPLCHNILEHVRFRDRFWTTYRDVNLRFAHATLEELDGRDALVWIQDYHLALAPRAIRDVRSDLTLAHFWHIPWPAWETFRVCPQKVQILEALLANDLIGFHLESFAQNFLDTCVNELEVLVDWNQRTIVHRGRATKVRALPISIDVERFETVAASPETAERMERIRERFGLRERKVGIGVDRLDYSKGILERLEALRVFFRDNPEYRGKFTFIQIAVPSRGEIPAYQHLAEKVDARIDALNDDLSTGDWRPIVYIRHTLPQDELAAFYRMADVAIISSVVDGMNLVVKEYIACQGDDAGAVCLSEFAGAADDIDHSIPVNPFYTEGFAEDIRTALEMPLEERRRRMEAMKARLRRRTIYTWLAEFLAEAAEARAASLVHGPA
ncbi:MAG: alpha,alpha-trehalose-phosphate synthase (UDP-forming) [Gemmatimonadota bacterium]